MFSPKQLLCGRSLRAIAILTLLFATITWGLFVGSDLSPDQVAQTPVDNGGDLGLYSRVVQGVQQGGSYYDVVLAEHLAGPYATTPPTAVRTPTLTYLHVVFGAFTPWILVLGVVIVVLALAKELEQVKKNRAEWYSAICLAALSFGMYANPQAAFLHEAWAAVFIGLAIVSASRDRTFLAVILALSAVLIRELAAPFLLLMFLLHIRKSRRSWGLWLGAIGVFGVVYALHWRAVEKASESLPSLVSPSWLVFGGWTHALDSFLFSSPLRLLPFAVTAFVLPLAILGWAGISTNLGNLVSITVGAFWLFLCFAGRPENVYWGHLAASLTLVGLAFAPRVIFLIFRDLRGRREGTNPTHQSVN